MISVIIPVYNGARFLNKCLRSIERQDYRNMEIIVVNDASTDRSGKILSRHSKKDGRIKIINKDIQEGVDKARFDGLKIARGRFIFFIDADDWLANKGVFTKLVRISEEQNADYVQLGTRKVLDRFGIIKYDWLQFKPGILDSPELQEKYYDSFLGRYELNMNCWGKLYRRELIEKAELKCFGYIYQEDVIFNFQLFPHLRRIVILSDLDYRYRWGGMTKKYNPDIFDDVRRQTLYKAAIVIRDGKEQYFGVLLDNLISNFKIEISSLLKRKELKESEIEDYIRNSLDKFNFNEFNELCQRYAGRHLDENAVSEIKKECIDTLPAQNKLRSKILSVLFGIIHKI